MVVAHSWFGCGMAVVWLWYGCGMVVGWSWFGRGMGVVWLWSGCGLVVVLFVVLFVLLLWSYCGLPLVYAVVLPVVVLVVVLVLFRGGHRNPPPNGTLAALKLQPEEPAGCWQAGWLSWASERPLQAASKRNVPFLWRGRSARTLSWQMKECCLSKDLQHSKSYGVVGQ